MKLSANVRSLAKRLLLGPGNYPQQCTLGLRDPQSEVAVWLHGVDAPINVTQSHLMAGGAPFTVGIALNETIGRQVEAKAARLQLRFYDRDERGELLGQIGLRFVESFSTGSRRVCLFHAADYENHCLPRRYLWARYWQYARYARHTKDNDVPITTHESRAMIVFYLCPRPIVLVSASDGRWQNMFPMNLMGPLGDGYFGFALNGNRSSAPLVERAGKIAISSVPLDQAPVVFRMGSNHRKPGIDIAQLPFPTTSSPGLGLPVPKFALRVRELEVETVKKGGSHTLFVARIVRDERWANGLQHFVAHGIYQAWRERHERSSREPSQAEQFDVPNNASNSGVEDA